MYATAQIEKFRETSKGTEMIAQLDGVHISDLIRNKRIGTVEIRFDDGRTISAEQRKKAYATIRDIADYTGYLPEEAKESLKYLHMVRTGCDEFSLSNCSMDTAREFINTLIGFALEWGIPLSEMAINRTDDIDKYLWYCLKTKRCAVCGDRAEIHHVDTIGMGFDRRKVNDADKRKIALCRKHHTIAHQRGMSAFEDMYKIYGITDQESR